MATRTLTVRLIGDDRSLRAATARSQTAMGKFSTFAKKAMKVGAAGVIVGTAASVKSFADFDQAMTNSLAIMDDVSKKQRKDMVDAAREVGRTTTFSAKDAAEAYFYLASAGLDATQSLKAMPQVAKFAQAGNFDLATATDLVTDAQSALGLSSEKASKNLKNMTRVSDVLVKANTLANATVQQFSESLTMKAGAAAKILGKDIEETTAVLAAFADQGLKGQMAGNALNIVWRDLQTAALKNKEAFKKQNVAVFDSKGEFRNTADVIGDLEKALGGMSDKQKKATLAQMGFQDRSQAFILTLVGSSKKIREYERNLDKAGGITDKVAKKQLSGLTAQFKLAWAQVQDMGLELGGALAPALKSAAQSFREFVSGIRTGTGAGGDFRNVVESLGAVLVPMGAALGSVTLDLAGFGLQLATSKAGIIALSTVAGALVGRLAGLAAAWAVAKVTAFVTAISNAVTMIRTAISVTTSLRAAVILLTGSTQGLRAAMLSTGIGAIAVLVGTAIGALMGMKTATEENVYSADRLSDALKRQADAMREVRDIDLDVAQRKANLVAANNALQRAQQRVNRLERAGKKGTLGYREAVNALSQAKIQQKRATREVNRAEADSTDKRRKARVEAQKTRREARERIAQLRDTVAIIREHIDEEGHSRDSSLALLRAQAALAREQKGATDSTLALKRIQLSQAEASGASKNKIKELRGEIKELAGKSKDGGREVKGLRGQITRLKNKRVTVDVDLNLLLGGASGNPFLGGDRKGSGWPLKDAIQHGAQAMADRDPMGFFMAASGGLGAGSAASVNTFTPLAAQFGLQVTSGYRPGDDGYHGINRARDYADGPQSMLAFAQFMATAFGSKLKELIHSPLGFSIKDGRRVPPYAVADHYDHVHVAMQRGGGVEVPGTGSGDKVPLSIMAEPKERVFVLNRNASDALNALGSFNGMFPRFQKGGVVSGRVSWFSGGQTAGGRNASTDAGLALNLHPGTDSGWNNPTTQRWMEMSRAGHPVYARTTIGGKSANLPIIDLGPAGWTGRAIDVTEAGVRKLGLSTSNFPTDSIGTARIGGGGAESKKKAKPTFRSRFGVSRENAVMGLGGSRAAQLNPLGAGRVPKVLQGLGAISRLFTSPGMTQEQRFGASELGLTFAAQTPGTEDDLALYQFQIGASRGRKRNILKRINRIDHILRTQKMSPRRRRKLLQRRNKLYGQLSTAQDRIDTAREGISGLRGDQDPPTARDFGERDLALAQLTETTEDDLAALRRLEGVAEDQLAEAKKTADPRDDIEAANYLKQIRDQLGQQDNSANLAQEIKALREEMERNRKIAESEMATSAAVARRALADIISGQLGPRSFHQAQTAGAGTVGSY